MNYFEKYGIIGNFIEKDYANIAYTFYQDFMKQSGTIKSTISYNIQNKQTLVIITHDLKGPDYKRLYEGCPVLICNGKNKIRGNILYICRDISLPYICCDKNNNVCQFRAKHTSNKCYNNVRTAYRIKLISRNEAKK